MNSLGKLNDSVKYFQLVSNVSMLERMKKTDKENYRSITIPQDIRKAYKRPADDQFYSHFIRLFFKLLSYSEVWVSAMVRNNVQYL